MALSDRLNRLEGDYGPELCEERYCTQAPTVVEVIGYPDSTEEWLGREPPTLCSVCPYAGDRSAAIRNVGVVKHY